MAACRRSSAGNAKSAVRRLCGEDARGIAQPVLEGQLADLAVDVDAHGVGVAAERRLVQVLEPAGFRRERHRRPRDREVLGGPGHVELVDGRRLDGRPTGRPDHRETRTGIPRGIVPCVADTMSKLRITPLITNWTDGEVTGAVGIVVAVLLKTRL